MTMIPDTKKSAFIIVDMQNDFVHPDGGLAHRARENPAANFDFPFLMSTIPNVARLAEAFRKADRPVVYIAHVVKPDYSDAQFPYWRLTPPSGNRTFIAEGSWGAQIVDDLKPKDGEHLVIKKGFGGFAGTPLDTILRNMSVSSCIVAGVMTSVCVSSTIRGGVEHNYRMILVEDGVADVSRDHHAAEIKILSRPFADLTTTDVVVATLAEATAHL